MAAIMIFLTLLLFIALVDCKLDFGAGTVDRDDEERQRTQEHRDGDPRAEGAAVAVD